MEKRTLVVTTGLEGVLFDLDGVLLDSMPGHVAAWQEAFGEMGLTIEADFFYRHEGMLDWEGLRPRVDGVIAGFSPAVFNRLLKRQRRIYLERYCAQVGLYPQAEPILEQLARAGLRLALVTSSSREVFSGPVQRWLDSRFDLVVTRDQVERGKPAPDPYLKALEGLGLAAPSALVVENAPAGVESAKAAGLFCVALCTTLSPSSLSQADLILPDLEALGRWLLQT